MPFEHLTGALLACATKLRRQRLPLPVRRRIHTPPRIVMPRLCVATRAGRIHPEIDHPPRDPRDKHLPFKAPSSALMSCLKGFNRPSVVVVGGPFYLSTKCRPRVGVIAL